jgi:CheY-like chemotaxis protein
MANILVVDDERGIRDAVGQVLREAGHGVMSAANGAEALERIREQPPDAILLDLNMPVMDGRTFLSACRAEPVAREVPVALFSTASADAVSLDVQARISKPFDLDDVTGTLARLLDQPSRLASESQSATAVLAAPAISERAGEAYRWAAAAARAQVSTLRRQSEATRERILRAHDRIRETGLCLNRAFVRMGQPYPPVAWAFAVVPDSARRADCPSRPAAREQGAFGSCSEHPFATRGSSRRPAQNAPRMPTYQVSAGASTGSRFATSRSP